MTPIETIKNHITKKLEEGLPSHLSYHNLNHTFDVLKQSLVIAEGEGVDSPTDLVLLQTSALYHDVGFIYVYNGHEEKSCEVAREELPGFGYSKAQVDQVCSMILATRIPQSPQSLLEKVICDADLDYLGRSDFYSTGEGLFKEFLRQGIVQDETSWNLLQVNFLERHHYFTQTCQRKREAIKQQHLEELRKKTAVNS